MEGGVSGDGGGGGSIKALHEAERGGTGKFGISEGTEMEG